jgi:ribonuclease J
MVRITCFDGVGCIGGNKILLEDGDKRLFFDFGKNFGEEGRYYEEFLQPKPCAGLYEKMQLNLLPPFRDLYREDLVSPLCDPWHGIDGIKLGDVGGVLVSHAHVDHIGAIHELRGDIPIYCSPMTAAISRALQDTGNSATNAEYCYYVARAEREGGELSTPHYKTHPFAGREYHLTDSELPDSFARLWQSAPGSRELEAVAYEPATSCAGLPVRGFAVDHSVFGARAWAVETSAGWVVYSGDLRLHGGYGHLTRRFAEEAAKLEPVAMLIEGTRIDKDRSYTEGDVRQSCLEAVKACKGLVVADFGPRNVERLISFAQVARETGRELAILPKDAYLLEAMRAAGGEQDVPDLRAAGARIYWEYQTSDGAWRKQVREQYPDLGVTPRDVHANQDKFICCLSFWDINELAYIQPVPDSLYVFSSCEAFNEEMGITAERLDNWLRRFDMRREGRLSDTEQESDPFHVSGHASGPDLMELVHTVRPKTLIPIHTTNPGVYAEQVGGICSVRIPEKGVAIQL